MIPNCKSFLLTENKLQSQSDAEVLKTDCGGKQEDQMESPVINQTQFRNFTNL